MKPFRILVNRLIDFGAIVTLIGVDAETSKPVTIHVDYRPFDVVWAAWRDIGSKQPIRIRRGRADPQPWGGGRGSG
jgi:hypothetical protein